MSNNNIYVLFNIITAHILYDYLQKAGIFTSFKLRLLSDFFVVVVNSNLYVRRKVIWM